MGFLDKLFGNEDPIIADPGFSFGRYSDAYKTDEQYDAWDRSLDQFEDEKYIDSYKSFIDYLKDEYQENSHWWEKDGVLHFELFQGSKKIVGRADGEKISAEAKIAHVENLDVGFMQRLLEQNFSLQHSRFALDQDDNLTIRFDSFNLDGSPYKLYYALKEVATKADKQDDLLIDEFRQLRPVEVDHLVDIPEAEKAVKYDFICKQSEAVFKLIEEGPLKTEEYPGAVAYLLLDLIYKFDYLIKPEGVMMETLERCHRRYFTKDGKSVLDKIKQLKIDLNTLIRRDKEDFYKEMYQVKSTFGITNPVNNDRVSGFVQGELPNMDWYAENEYPEVALSIPGYIVGYCMFQYAIPLPTRDLFYLYYRIAEHDFFRAMGHQPALYDSVKNQLDKRKIKRAIQEIVRKHQSKYPKFDPRVSTLKFNSLIDFARSYLLMIQDLNLARAL